LSKKVLQYNIFERTRGGSPAVPLHSDIVLGGVSVSSGDLVVGNQDGVAVVPRLRAEAVLQSVTTKMLSFDR